MTPEARTLFLKIHTEYELQVPTMRGETEYTQALLELQNLLLQPGCDVPKLEKEFEDLQIKYSNPSDS